MFGAVGHLQCYPGQRVNLSRIITGDETWIHHWDSDTKQESMQWKHVNSPASRKFRTQRRLESHGQCSGSTKRCCWWITYQRRQQWLDHTTVKCWLMCVRQWRRRWGECWPEVRCCSTIMLQRTCLEFGLNSCLAHLTHPTWHLATSTSTSEAAPLRNEVFDDDELL